MSTYEDKGCIYVWNEMIGEEETRIQRALGTVQEYRVQVSFYTAIPNEIMLDRSVRIRRYGVLAGSEEQAIELVGPFVEDEECDEFIIDRVELMTYDDIYEEARGHGPHDDYGYDYWED